jgi:multiple sugar transport system substrate-binding protein
VLRKSHFRLLVVAMLVVVLSLGAVVSAQDDPVEISIAGATGNIYNWLLNYVGPSFEDYMAEQGRTVTVNVIETAVTAEDLRQQYVLDLGVGTGADLMSFDGFWLPEFVEGGLVQPLVEIVGPEVMDWEGWEQIPEGLRSILGYQGEIYGIAAGTDARAIWFRTDIFEAAGLPTDWQPTSWEELLDAARAIKEYDSEIWPIQLNAGLSMGEATTMQGYLMTLLGAGHHIYDFEEEKWIVRSQAILDTLELYNTIYNEEELGNVRYQLAQNGRDLSFEAFSNGQVAMLIEGDFFWRAVINPGANFGLDNRNEIVSFAKMPAIEPGAGYNGQDFVTISGGTGYIINPNTSNPDVAWEFLSYMFSLEALAELQEIEPRIRARQDAPVTGDDVMSAIASDVLPYTTVRPPLAPYNRISVEAQLMTERVVSGEMTPLRAMNAYADAVIDIVGEDAVMELPFEE